MLQVNKTEYEYTGPDGFNRQVTRYQAELSGNDNCTFTGCLTFAFWEVWTNEGTDKHEAAKANTLDNAKTVLNSLNL